MNTVNELSSEIVRLKTEGLTYLTESALVEIKNTIRDIELNSIPGIFIETGCALGGSAILIALNKDRNRIFKIYDVFGLIPAPSKIDGEDVIRRYDVIKSGKSEGINDNKYYGYENDLKTKVINNFNRYNLELTTYNINLIEGLYEDTLIVNEDVAFAHIDCDWYESVMTCLNQIVPYLSKGGKLIIDDYYAWSGCRKATDEYFADKKEIYKFHTAANKLHVERL